jgi:hypothetical protein
MFVKTETLGSEPRLGPALATVLVVALNGTMLLGVYPRPLFDFAEASALSLGVVGLAATPLR